jgi:hypothetical protein
MTQYLISVWHEDQESLDANPDPEWMARAYAQVDALNQELQAAGAWVFGGGLRPPSSATVVHAADGKVSLTDGPYAEAKEQIGGFWIIAADDFDAALEWARKCSEACMAAVEVRPFQGE